MTLMLLLLWLLTVHFVADFVLQSDWMARNKSTSNAALLAHVSAYTAVLSAGMLAFRIWFGLVDPYQLAVLAAFNFLAHFGTDWVTSRINKRLWEAKKVHWFFVGVGADQLVHAWTLGLTAAVLSI